MDGLEPETTTQTLRKILKIERIFMEAINYKNKNAVAILRVSSGRQKDGISHSLQEQKSREYCEEK